MNAAKTHNNGQRILVAALLILLVPLTLLCLYIHPSADDLIYAAWYRVPVPVGFWEYHAGNYLTWNGRYFSTILLTLNPLVFGSFTGYKLLPIIIIIVFCSGFFRLIKNFFSSQSSGEVFIVTLFITVTYLDVVPSLPETLYWMSGAITYTLTWGLLFHFVASLIAYFSKPSKWGMLAVFVLAWATIGSNELAAFTVVLITMALAMQMVLNKSRYKNIALALALMSLLFALIVVLAPGNANRLSFFDNHHNLSFACRQSFTDLFKISILVLKHPALLMLNALAFINAPRWDGDKKLFYLVNNRKIFLLPLIFIIPALFFYFVSAFSMGLPPPLRLHGYVAFLLLAGCVACAFGAGIKYAPATWNGFNRQIINTILSAFFVIFVLTAFHKKDGENYYIKGNIMQALYDLTHDAPNYNALMNQRYELIEKSKATNKQNIIVPHMPFQPQSIFFVDIKPDTAHWINWGTAGYFNLKTIAISD